MEHFIIKNQFDRWCGYVIIPYHHPFHGLDMDQLRHLRVHGGISYAEEAKEYIEWFKEQKMDLPCKVESGEWIIGFDTSHVYSDLRIWTYDRTLQELQKLIMQIKEYA